MKVDRALATDGWMDPFEVVWLAAAAEHYSRIVEIGSFLGRSTVALADNTPGKVWAVDDWIGPRDTIIDDKKIDWKGIDLFALFSKNLEGLEEKIVVVKADHKKVPDLGIKPDLVFLDGSHEYVDVLFDIGFWWPELVVGGCMCGHDANLPGVNAAVRELLPDAIVIAGTKIWMLIKS
jgi:hypothetical protein